MGVANASIAATAIAAESKGRVRAGATAFVRGWLWLLVVLVVAMVAIGGATRLTGSGLSITEWKPVTGAVPPLSDGAWAQEFEKYRASSQYRNLNRGMELGEFKTIYWWEWSHRQLGRAIGLIFAVPLVGFWLSGAITRGFALRVLAIGALGGLQAMVGWIMVASGLEPGMVAVAPLKLMLHLVLASAILALLVWAADGVGARDGEGRGQPVSRPVAQAACLLLGLVALQIALGGLVAGSRAGWTYNTWPLMDGRLVPEAASLFSVAPWIENFVDNPALVQLNHRLVAYLLVAFALFHAWQSRGHAAAGGRAAVIAGLALGQMALGIATLVLVVPLWAGLAHQLLAMFLLMAVTLHVRRSLASSP